MKLIFGVLALILLVVQSCNKAESCDGTTVTCYHTLNYSCVVCDTSSTDPTLVVLSYSSHTDTVSMSSCDTLAWLTEERALDQRWKTDGSDHWKFFQSKYPNSCGCK